MHRVLILGGGFGGIATAVALRERLDAADEVVLVERRPTFVMGLRKNWALMAEGALAEGERSLASLWKGGDPRGRGSDRGDRPGGARRDRRRRIGSSADALVVALGAERDPDRIPGFREHAISIYDRDESDRGREAIRHTPAVAWSSGSSVRLIRARRHPSSSHCCCASASRSTACRPR